MTRITDSAEARRGPLGVAVLEDLPDPHGRGVLVRATLDMPLGPGARQPMATRRARSLQATLQWLLDRGARVTVVGDAGAQDPEEEAQRFGHVRALVEALAPGVATADVSAAGGVSAEQPDFIDGLVASHDLFVNDSFQWSYLPLPSLVMPAQRLPSAVGRGVQADLETLLPLLTRPGRPFVAVLGGDRSALRLHGLRGLVLRADTVLVGGAMALPLLQAIGKQAPGGTPPDFLAECRSVYGLARRVMHHVQLPEDLVWSGEEGAGEVAAPWARPAGEVVDIGPVTRLRFSEILEGAGAVLWAGALGRVEEARFAEGTRAVASALVGATGQKVVGGDALVSLLDAEHLLPGEVSTVSATDSALELLKNGDLAALLAMRS